MTEFPRPPRATDDKEAPGDLFGANREIMRGIAEASLDALITADRDGVIVEFSPSAERIYGYTREEAIGHSVAEIVIPPRLREAHTKGMKHYNATGEGPVINNRVEVPSVRKDGTEFDAELTVVPMMIGGARFFTAFVRDISEKKAAQRALLEAKEAAEQASTAKTRFLASVSHELRTPLNVVLGTMDVLHHAASSGRERELSSIAYASGESLLQMIDDLIDVAALDEGELTLDRQPTDIRALLRMVEQAYAPKARDKNMHFHLQLDAAVPRCLSLDAARLQQVLGHLIDNAIKFSTEGEVRVVVSARPAKAEDYHLDFQVHDQGIGIAPETQARILEPFAQVDSSSTSQYAGTGIGLGLCTRLLALMDTALSMTSAPGQGTHVSFSLLARTCVAQTDKPVLAPAPSTALLAIPRVLVVDDIKSNRMVAEALLSQEGVLVDAVADGREALERLKEQDYSAVLMDLRMPEMDGLETTLRIRRMSGSKARVPVIAMTANVSAADREDCRLVGMNDFIAKPVNREKLMASLRMWCPSLAPDHTPPGH